MKKLLFILLTFMMGFCTLQLSGQETQTVAEGTETNSYVPFYGLWMDDYTHSQVIYPADMLVDLVGATITEMTFYLSSSPSSYWGCPFNISLGETDEESYTSTAYFSGDLTTIYTGTITIDNDELTITFTDPYTYTGSNLVLDVQNTSTGTWSSAYFYGISTSDYQGAYAYSSSSTPTTPSSRVLFIPKTTFTFTPSGVNCFSPNSIQISDITSDEATLSWTPRDGQDAWEVCCVSGVFDPDQVTWIPATDTFYTFTGLTPATGYNAYVRTNCGDEVSNPRHTNFTTLATCASVPTNVTVSNITATSVDVNWTAGTDDSAWEVVVVPAASAPETGIPEPATDQPYTVNGLQDNTHYKVYVRTDCGGGDHSYWSTGTSFTTYPFCSSPLNVNVSQITGTSALVTWDPAAFGATNYTVEYTQDSLTWTLEVVDGTQFMISNLEPTTSYTVMVYSNCDLGTADTVTKTFTTNCLVGGNLQIGEGTNTSSYFPEYCLYNYSYTQQIYLAGEIGGAAAISSIAFQASSIANANRHLKIYLMNTSSANNDSWLNATTATLVFDATVTLTTGWNTFNFTTPFQYDGTSNLAVIVIDATGTWNSSNSFFCHTTDQGLSRYVYQDPEPYSTSSVPSNGYTSTNRNNVIFGIPCDEEITCVRPNVYVTETSETSVTLDWAPGYTESAWNVEYSDDNTTWTSAGSTTTHPYEVTGLNANTRYYFHVYSDCGSEQSEPSAATARTECGALTQLPYSEDFEDASTLYSTSQSNYILCWDRYASDPAHYVYIPSNSYAHSGTHFLDFHHTNTCFNIAIMPELDATIDLSELMVSFYACRSGSTGSLEVGVMTDKEDPTTFESVNIIDLSAAETYEYVEQHISLEDYTGTGTYVAFRVSNAQDCGFYVDDVTLEERPNCMYPSAVTITDVDNDNVTVSWTVVGTATGWNIEYSTSDFTPGEGQGTVISGVTDNPYTIENLTPATTYYIYIQSDCGSEWAGPVTATPGQYIMGSTGSDTLTTCGVIIYDNGGPDGSYTNNCNFTLVLYPENPDAVLFLSGTSNTEGNNYDYLRVYDGAGTSGTELAYYTGQNHTVNVMSQSGPLTLVFHSDGSSVYSGIAVTATCVTCYPPTNVTTSNPTLDGATVSWSGTGNSYVLYLNGDMTTGYPADDTTYTFTGLNSSTLYNVRVLSVCDEDSSMLSAAATFATSCDAITITPDESWTEDFENYTGSGVQQFVCWDRPITQTVSDGIAPFVYCGYGQAAHSGTNTAEFKGTLNMLALPEFTNNLSELRLSFWATGFSYSNTNVEVGYITDINDTSTFVFVANAGTPGARGSANGGNGNYMGPFSFSGISASGARIALRYTGSSTSSGWNVDDFIVEITPDCESPMKTSVTATNIGGHVANINWVDNDDTHSAWVVYYKESTDSIWSTAPATDTTVTLTGLNPLTTYDVYVITNCGTPETNPDATHTIHFTTTVACPAPTGLTLASISTDEATITWNGTANSYNVEYGVTGFTPGTGTIGVANTESFTMMNLDPSTSYTIYVNSDCTDDNDSLSTTVSFTFTTTQVPADLPYTADFTADNEWILNNGSCTNYWATGTVNSTPSLFVTSDGTTPGYSTSSNSIVSAEKLLAVGDNVSINLSFDVYVGGEGDEYPYDYLKVFLAPAETEYPAATTIPTYASYTYTTNAVNFLNFQPDSYYPYKLNLTDDTLHIAVEMTNPYDNPTTTSAAKLVFVWRNDGSQGTQPGAIISNVNVSVNNCPMPSALTVDNIGMSSADVSWTPGDIETAWVLEYKEASEDTWTTQNITTTPNYQLTNLNAMTTYNVRVKADCGSGYESMYTSTTFNTNGCEVSDQCSYTFNLYDSFGDGWNGASLDVQQNGVVIANLTISSGSSATETVTLCDNISTSLVWHSGNYDSEASFTVMGPNGTEIYTSSSISAGTLTTFTTDCNGTGPVVTDPTVATNAASAIAQTTATLNGEITNPDNVTITAKGFEWKTTTGGSYTQIAGTGTGNTFTANLTGLTANTSYTFKAFITFDGNTVYGSEMSFTTLNEDQEPCNAPTNLTVSNVTATSATMGWTAGGSETSWKVGYKLQSASQWQEATVQTTSYNLEGLTASSTYDVRVKALCANGESDFVTSSFTTGVGIENITLANSISLMPNPADNYIDLRVNSNVSVNEAVVYNAFGQMVKTVSLTDNHARIDLSDMASGMYFVRVNGENTTATKKFIRK